MNSQVIFCLLLQLCSLRRSHGEFVCVTYMHCDVLNSQKHWWLCVVGENKTVDEVRKGCENVLRLTSAEFNTPILSVLRVDCRNSSEHVGQRMCCSQSMSKGKWIKTKSGKEKSPFWTLQDSWNTQSHINSSYLSRYVFCSWCGEAFTIF